MPARIFPTTVNSCGRLNSEKARSTGPPCEVGMSGYRMTSNCFLHSSKAKHCLMSVT